MRPGPGAGAHYNDRMIVDSTELPTERRLTAHVCVVGAGAAGITLACELIGSGLSVLLLEAGGWRDDPVSFDDYRGSAAAPHPAANEYRRVRFGGTTGIWGGRCVPFDPIDFQARDYLPHSGWPIQYQELAQHYPRALEYCDAGECDFTVAGSLPGAAPTIAGFDGAGAVLADQIERYSLPTDFGARYRKRLATATNVTVALEGRCVALQRASGAERLAQLEFVDRAGRRRSVTAQHYVLACGGIEVPRLLLAAGDGGGLGNHHNLVGRYYGCHIETTFGRLVPHGATVAFDFETTRDGVYCRRKFQFSDLAQREHRLLNSAFRLHFPNYADASHGSSVMSAIYLAKSALLPEYRAILRHDPASPAAPLHAHARNVLRGLPSLARFGWRWLWQRQLARRKLPYTLVANADGSYPLEFNCEQTPLANSRITLGSERDRHGLPRVCIDWRIDEADVAATARAWELLRERLQRGGACRLDYDAQQLPERIRRAPPLGGHHLGTARMAANERAGVVDGNCAVYTLPNLLIASAAVFPTGSHANPTLSIVALALRIAARLRAGAAARSGATG